MPLTLLWVGLALLPGFIASGNSRSFQGWFIPGLIIDPIPAGLVYWLSSGSAHETPSATSRKSDLLVHHTHHLYDLPAVHYLHSW
ncbi:MULTISPECIES: hypothetical protein [Enterobacteriaceae]|uniref:hypothetical protein n=1 Tax=Enterobacterales TaxID=91347 RepID=UPI0003A1D7A8|nr:MULTISPECIES: hypothetical protein [Enterobacteriaceae]EKX4146262.1 hypothetical protein [Enterobacter cloacae]EKV3654414.1 hypothetical protein [Klebsiella quasipneumoniae]MBD0756281.1 hypothetical protein [Klebsiella quasipneumoniae]MBW4217328.1 hypothetical protein [Enterobacter cloacae subsp. cloacae]MDK1867324.1 hypothetical protein [Klebsiella sp. K5-307]